MLPTTFPPLEAVYQQTQRWIAVGWFERMVHDLRVLPRWLQDRADRPTATILDSRTLRSTPESGAVLSATSFGGVPDLTTPDIRSPDDPAWSRRPGTA